MLLQRYAGQPILLVNGRRGRGVVSVVPQSLRCAAVACGTGPAGGSYDMNAAFMSSQQHGSGNHAVPVRCNVASGEEPVPVAPWLLARRAKTTAASALNQGPVEIGPVYDRYLSMMQA